MSNKFRVLQNDEKITLAKKIPLLSFCSAVDQELKCIRCNVLPVKHYISGCQHLFCSDCFNDLRTQNCPACHEKLDKIKLRKFDLEIEKRIFSLKVTCPNRKSGCQETIPLLKLLEHERVCPYPLPTTITNGNSITNNGLPTMAEPLKDSVQRMHEGLSPIIREKTALRLREDMQREYDEWTKQTVEQLQNERKEMEEAFQYKIDELEQRFMEEMEANQTKQIHDKSLQLKADFAKDLTNVEENVYAANEKLTERLAKQENEIVNLKAEIEIISEVLRSKSSSTKSNDNIDVLICGQSSHRSDFIHAMANYLTFETSKLVEEGGLIHLNPVYTMRKNSIDGAVNNHTEHFQLPIEESTNLRIISWENPPQPQSQSIAFDSNYHEDSHVIHEFDLLDNPIFSILDKQFRSLNAVLFLVNSSSTSSSGVDNTFFRLLNYFDRKCLQQNVKFVFVDDEQKSLSSAEAIEFLLKETTVAKAHLEACLTDESVFWINLQPYKSKSVILEAEVDEQQWQNSVVESRRLMTSIINDSQLSRDENASEGQVVNSILASKEAIKAINKLTQFYHESIVYIISNTEISQELKSEIEDMERREEQVQNAWFNKQKQIAAIVRQKDEVTKELATMQSGIKATNMTLEKEEENIAILIARIQNYFENNLIFKRNYLDKWLWRYVVENDGHLRDVEEAGNRGGWLSYFRRKSTDGVSPETKLIASKFWSKLKKDVADVQRKVQLADNDGTVEEGFRIGNQVQRLLENVSAHNNCC